MMFSKEKQKLSPAQRLMRTGAFNQDNLTANQQGQLSWKQKFNFRIGIMALTLGVMGAYLIIIGGTLCGYVNRAYGIEGATWFLVLNMIAPIIIDLILLYRQRQRFAVGHVEAFTGFLVKPEGSRKYTRERSYLAIVNKIEKKTCLFEIDGWPHDAFVEGEIYTIYSWSFDEKRILSAEHASDI